MYATRIAYYGAKDSSTTNWVDKLTTAQTTNTKLGRDLLFEHVLHVIIIPNYKEDMGTLSETLAILASHSRAKTQYRICLAMEETEFNSQDKAYRLILDFRDSFYEIRFTIHPKMIDGEIRGKSSNVAWAAQQMARIGGGNSGMF